MDAFDGAKTKKNWVPCRCSVSLKRSVLSTFFRATTFALSMVVYMFLMLLPVMSSIYIWVNSSPFLPTTTLMFVILLKHE